MLSGADIRAYIATLENLIPEADRPAWPELTVTRRAWDTAPNPDRETMTDEERRAESNRIAETATADDLECTFESTANR